MNKICTKITKYDHKHKNELKMKIELASKQDNF